MKTTEKFEQGNVLYKLMVKEIFFFNYVRH